MTKKERSSKIYNILSKEYPNAKTGLIHKSPFQLLVSTILSAQCTDERVNMVVPELFKEAPTAIEMAQIPLKKLETLIFSTGFYKNKAKNIKEMAKIVLSQYPDGLPDKLDELVKLPGVGRKTANVLLGQWFGIPGITVDTHVKRITNRLGFTKNIDPVKIEKDLMRLWPKEHWTMYSTVIILHGRAICKSRKPQCSECCISFYCPSQKK